MKYKIGDKEHFMYRLGDVIRNKYSGLTGVIVAFGNTSTLKAYVDGLLASPQRIRLM